MSKNTVQHNKSLSQSDNSKLLNVSDAAQILGVSPSTLRNYEKELRITSVRQNNGYRVFKLEDIQKLKEELRLEKIQKETTEKLIKKERLVKYNIQTRVEQPVKLPAATEEVKAQVVTSSPVRTKTKVPTLLLALLAVLAISGFGLKSQNQNETVLSYAEQKEQRANMLIDPNGLAADVLGYNVKLGQYDMVFHLVSEFLQNVTLRQDLTVDQDVAIAGLLDVAGQSNLNGGVQTSNVNFIGAASINGLGQIDTTTETTLETALDIAGDVVSVDDNGLTEVRLAEELSYDGTLEITGTINIDGTFEIAGSEVSATADELNTLAGLSAESGGVYFSDGSTFAQDSVNFFWNDSNDRLGLGTNTPTSTLDVSGTVTTTGLILSTGAANGYVLTSDASGNASWQSAGSTGPWQTNSNVANLITATDNVTIGSATNLGKLAIDGDTDEVQLLIQGNSTQTNSLVTFENSAGTDLFNFSNTGDLTISSSLILNSETIDDITGSGLTLSSGALTIQTITATNGLSSTITNGSGLEVFSGGISLLQGCANGEILKWNETNDSWECATDSGASSAIINVESNDTPVGASVDTLDFTTDFTLSASPANEVNISIADDIVDYDELQDTLDLDATTETNLGANNLIFDLDSTGDFIVQDGGTAFIQFLDDGTARLGQTDYLSVANTGDLTFVDANDGATITGPAGGNLTIDAGNGEISLGTNDNLNLTAAIDLIFGGVTSLGETTGATDSGAYLVGVFDEFANSNGANVQAVLNDLDAAIGSGASKFTQDTGFIYLTNTTDQLIIGGNASLSSKLAIDGDADEIQLLVQGNGTQTTNLVVFENSAGTDQLALTNTGNLTLAGDATISGGNINGPSGADLQVVASGGNLILSGDSGAAGSQIQFANEAGDTTYGYFITGSTNTGDFAVDTNSLYVDASGNNVGIGTTTPTAGSKLEVHGTTTDDADYIGIFNQDNNADENSTNLLLDNDVNLGTISAVDRTIINLDQDFDPVATLSSSSSSEGRVIAYGTYNTIEVSGLDLGNADTEALTQSTYGDFTYLLGSPTINDTVGTGGINVDQIGVSALVSYTPTITNLSSSTTFVTMGGQFSNLSTNTGNANLTNYNYGIVANSSGTLGTAGTTQHVGGSFTAGDLADNNYAIYVSGSYNATNNYGLYFNDAITDGATNYVIYSAAPEQSYLSGSLGLGDTTPDAKLEVLNTSEQLRLSYADGTQASFTVDTNGDLSIDASGGDVTLASGDNLNLTSAGDLMFAGTTSLAETTGATDSGAYLVGVNDEFTNSNSTNVQAVLNDLDTAIGAGASKWTQGTGLIYLTTTTDEVIIGGSTSLSSKLAVDGDADEIQLLVQGHSTQNANLVVFENSAGSDQLALTNTGNLTIAGDLIATGGDITGTNSATIDLGEATTGALTFSAGNTGDYVFNVDSDTDIRTTGGADGTDALVVTAGDILLSDGDLDLSGGDFNVALDAGDGVNITKGAAPTVDVFTINGGTSATDGVDNLQLTFVADDASGNVLDISPTFTDNNSDDAAETWNVIDIDSFTTTVSDTGAGAITGNVRGLNIGTLTETTGNGDSITSAALNIGTGWDTVINAGADTDQTAIIGRVRIDARASDLAYFSHYDQSGLTGYAVRQGATGATVLNSESGQVLTLAIGNSGEVTLNTTELYPTSSDGSALGSATNMWSDLFLANGGIINFNAGDVTLTHSANLLTFAGGDLTLGSGADLNLSAAGDLVFAGTTTLAETTSPTDSGAYFVGVNDEFTSSNSTNVQDVLDDLDAAIGAGASKWTQGTGLIYLTSTTDEVIIGGSASLSSKLAVDGDADEIQLLVQGHSTQNANLVIFENSAGSDLLSLSNTGDLTLANSLIISSTTLDTNSLDFTGAGTIATGSGSNLTLTPAGAGDIVLSADDDSDINTTATLTSTGRSIFDLNLTLGADADTDIVSAINVDVTSANTGDADTIYGIQLGDVTSADGTVIETAVRIGEDWQNALEVEGSTNDGVETFIVFSDPTTSDKTITFPDDTGTVCLSSGNCAGGAGGSKWTDGGAITYLTSTTDDLAVGGTDATSPLFFDESAELLTLTNTTAGNSFVVNDVSSDTTPFVIDANGSVAIGVTSPTTGAKLEVRGSTAEDADYIAIFNQDNNATENSTNVLLDNDVASGTVSDTTVTLKNLDLAFNPTATISNVAAASTINIQNISNALGLDNFTYGNTTTGEDNYTEISGLRNVITGSPTINETSGDGGAYSTDIFGAYSYTSLTPTITNLDSSMEFRTYGGLFGDATTTAGNANLNVTSYGIFASSSGNLTTTGNNSHYGIYTTASGTADNNYALYVGSAGNATNNYGLYIADSITDGATNYSIYSEATEQSYLAGNLGIGDTTPDAKLEVLSTTEQLRLSYADGTQASFTVDTNGDLSIDASGGDVTLATGDNLNLTAAGDLIFGGTTSLAESTSPTDSGAYLVGVNDEFANSTGTNVQDVLDDLDAAIGAGASKWTQGTGLVYLTTTTDEVIIGGSASLFSKLAVDGDNDEIQLLVQGNATQTTSLAVFENSAGTDQATISNTGDLAIAGDLIIGGTSLATSMFSIDESAGTFLFGGDQSANPTLTFEATDSDTANITFDTNDTLTISGGYLDANANVAVGDQGSISTSRALNVVEQYSDTSGTVYGTFSRAWATNGADSSAGYIGVDGNAIVDSSVSSNITGSIRGFNSFANHLGTGTLSSGYGLYALVDKGSTGALTNAYGVYTEIRNLSATNAITSAYGLYIADSTETGTITNDYGIYQVDTGAMNYLGGSLGLGDATPDAVLDIELATAEQIVIDASSTDTTITTGVADFNIDAGDAVVLGLNMDFTQANGASTGVDATALNLSLAANDADGDVFGQIITSTATANAGAGSYEALLKLVNAENTAGAVTDAILIDSTSATDTDITDAIDVSDDNIVNALNIGANVILGTTGTINFDNFDVASAGGITIASGQTLTIGTTGLSETTGATDSGAYLVGTFDEFNNSNGANVQDVLDDLDAAIGAGASKFTQGTGLIYLTNTTDEVIIGGSASLASKLAVDGDNDEIQLLIQGNATQTSDLVVFETSAGANLFTLTGTGALGLGDATPDAAFEILATSEQLRLTYADGTADARFSVDTNGDITLTSTGGGTAEQLILANTQVLNIGGSGSTDVAYNIIGDSASVTLANSDDDLYIEGTLEVDNAARFEGATDLVLAGAENLNIQNTTYSDNLLGVVYVEAATSAGADGNNPALGISWINTDDATVETQTALRLNLTNASASANDAVYGIQVIAGSGSDAIDAGLHIQSATTGGFESGILIDGSSGGMTYGINIDSPDVIGTDINLQNGESIDNDTDNQIALTLGTAGTLLLSSGTSATIANDVGDILINSADEVIFSDTDTLIIGGHAGAVAYNVLSDSGGSPTSGSVTSDNDLYIQGFLEIDGGLQVDATVTATDFSCTDCLDFAEFENTLDVDETTDINLGTSNLTIDLDSSGIFDIRDGATTFVSFDDDSTIDITFPAAGTLGIDAVTTDNSSTAGVINLDVDTITSTNKGISIDYQIGDAASDITTYSVKNDVTVDSDAGHSPTVYGEYIGLTVNDATSTTYGIAVVAEDAGAQVMNTGVLIENLQATDIDLTDALLVRATTNDSIVDAIDVSDGEITNAINLGANFALLEGTRIFGSSAGVITFEDTSGNDLATLTDNANAGDLAITGAYSGDTISLSSGSATAASFTRSSAGQWIGFNDGTDVWGLYNTAGSPEGALTANTGALSMDTTNGTLYVKTDDGDNTGWVNLATGGSSPFTSSGGIIDYTTATDRLRLAVGETGDIGLEVLGVASQTASSILIDNATNTFLGTTGALDINVVAGNATVIGADINIAQSDGATAATDVIAQNITLAANDADGDVFGTIITSSATANAAAGSYEALLKLVNAENTIGAVTDAILIDSTSSTDTDITDAIDISDANIVNALNIGQNYLLGDGIRQFSASSTVWTFEDTSGNDLLTLTDNGSDGNATLTGDLTVSGGDIAGVSGEAIDLGEATADTLTFTTGASTELLLNTTNLTPGVAEGNSLGSATAEWEQLFLGDDNGISFGLDQDWTFAYDEAGDDRLELSTSGTSGMLISSATVSGTGLLGAFDSVTTGRGLDLSIDALTTGDGFRLQSTTTSASFSGNLGLVEWAPGSATAATGDLFQINIGTNGTTTGSLFTVTDAGTNLFSIKEAIITSALPHEFTAAGDVSIAYDVVLTNQTSSQIESYGPMSLISGESFESNNLTLKTYNSGDIVFDIPATGYATFQGAVSLDTYATFTAADTTPDVSGGSYFNTAGTATITDFDAGSGTLNAGHMIVVQCDTAVTFDVTSSGLNGGTTDIVCADGDMTTWIYDGTDWNLLSWMDDSTDGGQDLAEYFVSNETLEPGDVVSVDPNETEKVIKSNVAYQTSTIGVVSTKPGLILGGPDAEDNYLIGLAGRVPTKISSTSLAIEPGDYLTASNEPGKAMKANQTGRIIGQALEAWTPGSGNEKIMIFINPGWYTSDNLAMQLDELGNLSAQYENLSTLISTNVDEATQEVVLGVQDSMEARIEQLETEVAMINELLDETSESSETTESSTSLDITEMLTQMLDTFSSFQNFVAALGITSETDSEGNDLLSIASDLVVLGDATLNNVQITGDLGVGLVGINSLENSIDVVGPTCFGEFTGLNEALCETQTLFVQKGLSGNVNFFNGKIVLSPNGTLSTTGTIDANKVVANEFVLNDTSTLVGEGTIPAGQTEVIINNTSVKTDSKIFVTAKTSTGGEALYVAEKIDGTSFKIKIDNALLQDINFDWWILNTTE